MPTAKIINIIELREYEMMIPNRPKSKILGPIACNIHKTLMKQKIKDIPAREITCAIIQRLCVKYHHFFPVSDDILEAFYFSYTYDDNGEATNDPLRDLF